MVILGGFLHTSRELCTSQLLASWPLKLESGNSGL